MVKDKKQLKPIKPGQVYAWYPLNPGAWAKAEGRQYWEIIKKKGTHWEIMYLFGEKNFMPRDKDKSMSTLQPKEIASGNYTLVHEDAVQFKKVWEILYKPEEPKPIPPDGTLAEKLRKYFK